MKFMKIQIELPKKVKVILETLYQGGYEGYAVGGCVRDALLGRIPYDWDITTSARPLETKALFERTIDTGIQHGTVTVMIDHEGFEVTTYRIDGEYTDSRHPKEVSFTSNLVEDLKRRDFTINAMAYNETRGLVDEFEGLRDLEEGKIRCVGEPEERFGEDALRILRAVRFSAQLGFSIEEKTKEAVRKLAPTLKAISAERIQTELVKLLLSPNPQKMDEVVKLGIAKVVIPELEEALDRRRVFDRRKVDDRSSSVFDLNRSECGIRENDVSKWSSTPDLQCDIIFLIPCFCPMEKSIRLAAILQVLGDNGEESAKKTKKVLKRLKFDNDTIEKTTTLVRFHDLRLKPEKALIRKAVYEIGEERFPMLLSLWRAEQEAFKEFQNSLEMRQIHPESEEAKIGKEIQEEQKETQGQQSLQLSDRYMREEKLRQIENLYDEIRKDGDCLSLKTLAVTGRDLIDAGMKPGKELGEHLTKLLFDVLEHPEHNTKEYLLYSVFS